METDNEHKRDINLSPNGFHRFLQTLGRGALRRCPYCGGSHIFKTWFTLKDRCPNCNTLFAREEGYFLGSYPLNLGLTSIIAIAVVLWLIGLTDLSVLQMQVLAVVLVVGLPLFLYPYMLSLWMAIDLLIHPDLASRERA
jgi:uncharacterized protein (DUF983 family)